MSESERDALVSECRRAAGIAEKQGVVLCMECHKKTFTQNCEDAVYLMNAVASPHFKMYWQPFQWQTPAQNLLNAQRIAPFAEHIHVFNWRDGESGELRKYPLGEAVEVWREYLEMFSGQRALLLEFMPDGKIESLCVEADALRKIVEN